MRYPGGKGRCYRNIIGLMKPHDTYIETHLGGGAVMRHKRPAPRNIGVEIDPDVVARWNALSDRRCELVHGDAVSFLRSFPFVGTELIYADPPYLPETRRRARVYRHDYDVGQHVILLECLKKLPCAVIVSGYGSDLYDDMLEGWRREEFKGDSHVGPRTEVAWLNYAVPDDLHDLSFLGDNFRERERIRRRRDGLLARIDGLCRQERHALIESLTFKHTEAVRQALERAT